MVLARVVAGLVVLAAASPAAAQINSEKLRSWERPGFGGSSDFSLTLIGGNLRLMQVAAGLRVQWASLREDQPDDENRPPDAGKLRDLVYLVGSVSLGRIRDDNFLNNGFAHLRWTRMWRQRFGTEVFGQAQHNEFIKLRERALGGAGVRAVVLEEENVELTFGTAYMLEYERLQVPRGSTEQAVTWAHRWSSYFSAKLFLADPRVQIVNTVYLQPWIGRWSDYRIFDELEVEVTVVKALKLVVGFSLRYDSDPPVDLVPLDTTIVNRLRVDF